MNIYDRSYNLNTTNMINQIFKTRIINLLIAVALTAATMFALSSFSNHHKSKQTSEVSPK